MPTYNTDGDYDLRALTGANPISDVDAGFAALRDDIDGTFAGYSEGPIGSRPTSSPGTPGIAGRIYRATNAGPNPTGGSTYYLDHGTGWNRLARVIGAANATWNPASVANGASTSTTVTVSGALAGDLAHVAFPGLPGGVIVSAQVSAANTVTVTLANLTGSAYDAASTTITVAVVRAIE